jgi:phosphoglycolate phosphatase
VARILLLDLDGTLVDTAPDLSASLNRLMVSRGLTPFSLDETKAMIGDGVKVLVGRAFAARAVPEDDRAMDDFTQDYGARLADASKPFPGVPEFMRAHAEAGWRMAVCTNKTEAAARTLLETLGLMKLVCAIGGGDSFPVRKPDPAHLLSTLLLAGADPASAVMVGDHRNDVVAAHGAGMKVVFVTWGYGPVAMGQGADAVAHDLPALSAAVERLLPGPA